MQGMIIREQWLNLLKNKELNIVYSHYYHSQLSGSLENSQPTGIMMTTYWRSLFKPHSYRAVRIYPVWKLSGRSQLEGSLYLT